MANPSSCNKQCTVREMRIVEENAEWLGVTEELMMENAGAAVAAEVAARVGRGARIAVIAGTGGKAGDGMVAARHLAARGFSVDVLFVESARRIRHRAALANYERVKGLFGIRVLERYTSWIDNLDEYSVIVDAMLGTGFHPPLTEPYLSVVKSLNRLEAFKVAIDIPTGVEPDTGEVEPTAFKADLTVTMHCCKPGLLRDPGSSYAGEVVVAEIGVPPDAELLVGPGDLRHRVKPYNPRGHKGVNGRVLVVGGSAEYHGAPWLAAMAALEAGADLVYLAAPETVIDDSYTPEIIPVRLPGEKLHPASIGRILDTGVKFDAVVIGPGLGRNPETIDAVVMLLEDLRELGAKVVVDADALYALSLKPRVLDEKFILTPHLGEASRLLGSRVRDDLEARISAARSIAARYRATVLLKGWVDVVAHPAGRYRLNKTGSPQMTVGGTGDVLAGVTAALSCRTENPYYAAAVAAYVVGRAGELVAAEEARVTPLRLLRAVPRVLWGKA